MSTDPNDAAALANRLNEVMRALPPETQPLTVITALCAMLARAIGLLRPEDRKAAFDWAVELIRAHAELETRH